jgi:hypothetical protein
MLFCALSYLCDEYCSPTPPQKVAQQLARKAESAERAKAKRKLKDTDKVKSKDITSFFTATKKNLSKKKRKKG